MDWSSRRGLRGLREEEFHYAVRLRTYERPTFAFREMTVREDGGDAVYRAEVYLGEGSQDYGIFGYDERAVIANFMLEYDMRLRWQRPAHRRR